LVLLADGVVRAAGAPAEVLRRDVAEAVFGWPLDISTFDDRPQLTPRRRNR
jgi:ABC-type hemin transport system ATPase subunit